MKIKIATSQFPVSPDISGNKNYIISQMGTAKDKNADIIHFPEGSLSGYAGIDFESFENFDWDELKSASLEIIETAKSLGIWILLGSTHRLIGKHKPHNSLYIINDVGEIVDRYDKMFCAGDNSENTGDLKHYSPGNHFCIFSVKGIKCGTVICHDYRYPDLYKEYKIKDVKIMFHSFHAGNMNPEMQKAMEKQVGEENHSINPGKTIPEITMPSAMITYAANYHIWISGSNTSAPESCWGSMVVRPDGVITGILEKNKTDILITEIDTAKVYYNSTRYWCDRSFNGIYHSGTLVEDERSKNRTKL